MPDPATLKKISPTNPFAVCNARGMGKGSPKHEACVEGVTKSALARKNKNRKAAK